MKIKWKFITVIIAFGIFSIGCSGVQLKNYAGPRMKIAVIHVEAVGNGQPGIKEQFEKLLIPGSESELFKTRRFDVINRNKLETLLAEQQLTLSGAIQQNNFARVGEIGGVEGVVFITVTGGEHRSLIISFRLLNSSTASVMGVSDCKAEPVEQYQAALSDCAIAMANEFIRD